MLRSAVNMRMAAQYDRSDSLFSEYRERFPASYVFFMEAGLCKLELAQYDQAHSFFKSAYEHMPTSNAALWCGVSLRRAGNFRAAVECLEDALRVDQKLVAAKVEMASCYEALEDFANAIRIYKGLLAAKEAVSRTYIYNRLGWCYEKTGDVCSSFLFIRGQRLY